MDVDVAIMGAGIAGLSAGLRARELGARAVVFERSAETLYPCNSRLTGGVFHVAFTSVEAPPERLKEAILAATYGSARPDLADLIGREIGPAVTWLKQQGAHFIRTQAQPYYSAILAPPGLRRAGLHWKGFGGDVLLRKLADKLEAKGGLKRGIRIMDAHRIDDGRYHLDASGPNGETIVISARAVIFADGGFAGNADMLRSHISPRPDALCQRGAGTGQGDGARIGASLGAKLTDLNRFYGHVQSRGAVNDTALWPYPVLDHIVAASIVVDRNGDRFADEGRGGIYVANRIAGTQDPLGTFVIFDQPAWEGPGRAHRLPPNSALVRAGGVLLQADTLENLARQAAIDPDGLASTVARYNGYLAGGAAPSPTRSLDRYKAWPVATPPFYAVPLCAGITYTMGGLTVDANACILDEDDRPIEGLYAAGATTAGLEGGEFAGYTGGLSKSLVLGLKAGESAASYASALQPVMEGSSA